MLLPACLLAPHPSKILPIPPPFSLSLLQHTSQSRSPSLSSVGILQQLDFSPSVSLSHSVSCFSQQRYCQLFTAHLLYYCRLLCADLQDVGETISAQILYFFPPRLFLQWKNIFCLINYCIFASRTTFCGWFLVYFNLMHSLGSFSDSNWRQVPIWLPRVKRFRAITAYLIKTACTISLSLTRLWFSMRKGLCIVVYAVIWSISTWWLWEKDNVCIWQRERAR